MCYSLWYNAPTMLPAGSLDATHPGYRPATSWMHYTTRCNTLSSAPEDGRNNRPKHVEVIGIINKIGNIIIISLCVAVHKSFI